MAMLPPLSALPFGSSGRLGLAIDLPQPNPDPGNAPEHCSSAPSSAPPPAVPVTRGSSPGRSMDLLL